MNFYNLEYITQNQSFNLVFRSVVLIMLLVIVMLTSLHYMRNRLKTRLRDISIGIVVLMLVLLGIQVEDYMQNNHDFSQSQVLVKFIESVATDNDILPEDILVNSTVLRMVLLYVTIRRTTLFILITIIILIHLNAHM